VGRVTTAGAVTPTPAPATDSTGVARGGDGAYWFAQFTAHKLGRLTPQGGYAQPISFPLGSGPRHIAAGSGNTLWVGLETANKVARVTGVTPPTPGTGSGGAAAGGAGAPAGAPRDTVAPALRRLRVDSRRRRLSVRVSEPARLRLQIERRRGGRWVRVRSLTRRARRGANRVSLGRRLRRGRYRLSVVAVDAAGNRSKTARKPFRVKR
jgi:hypothetical protein